jgi:hypothetical protein
VSARRIVAPLACLLLLAGGAACGETDEDQVRATLQRFEQATAEKDYRTLCSDVLARELVQRLNKVGLPCELALQKGLGGVFQPGLNVEKVRVSGDTAFARVIASAIGENPSRETIKLTREDGDWRVAALSRPGPPAPQRDLGHTD